MVIGKDKFYDNLLVYRKATKYSQIPLSVQMNVPEGEYLSVMELGEVLNELSYQNPHEKGAQKQRKLHKHIVETGKLNLVAVDAGNTMKFKLIFIFLTFSISLESCSVPLYGGSYSTSSDLRRSCHLYRRYNS